MSSTLHSLSVTPAAIAGVTRSELWIPGTQNEMYPPI